MNYKSIILQLSNLIDECTESRALANRLIAEHMKKETGLYWCTDGKLYHLNFFAHDDNHGWKYGGVNDIGELVNETKSKLSARYGNNWQEDLKYYEKFENLFNYHYFRRKKKGQYLVYGYFDRNLVYLLDFVVNGQMPEDYQRANEMFKGIRVVGKTHMDENFPGVSIKTYSNGRIDIKGLTDAQYDKIEEIKYLVDTIKRK